MSSERIWQWGRQAVDGAAIVQIDAEWWLFSHAVDVFICWLCPGLKRLLGLVADYSVMFRLAVIACLAASFGLLSTSELSDQELPMQSQIRFNTEHLERVESHLRDMDSRIERMQQEYYEIKNQNALLDREILGHRWILGVALVALIGNLAAILFAKRDQRSVQSLRREFQERRRGDE